MPIHDAYARLTPFELLVPDDDFPARHFPGVTDEAAQRGTDVSNPAAFVMLGAVAGALAEIRPEDAPPESLNEHASILFFAYHLWRTGRSLALLTVPTLRALLVEERGATKAAEPGWEAALKNEAGYLQLPQHMVWIESTPVPASPDPSSPDPPDPDHPDLDLPAPPAPAPESVDGLFWVATDDAVLHAAAVTGIRPDRPGLSLVSLPPEPLASLADWATGPARDGGDEFATSLPGAELEGLLGLQTPAEVLKLLALALHRFVIAPRQEPEHAPTDPDVHPRPTSLPYVTL